MRNNFQVGPLGLCFHKSCQWKIFAHLLFPRKGVSRLGFPEQVRKEILHQVSLMWDLFSSEGSQRDKFS